MEREAVKYDRIMYLKLRTLHICLLPKYMSNCIIYSTGILRMLEFTKGRLSFLQVCVQCIYIHCRNGLPADTDII